MALLKALAQYDAAFKTWVASSPNRSPIYPEPMWSAVREARRDVRRVTGLPALPEGGENEETLLLLRERIAEARTARGSM